MYFTFNGHTWNVFKSANKLINHILEFLSTTVFVHNVMRKTTCKQTLY